MIKTMDEALEILSGHQAEIVEKKEIEDALMEFGAPIRPYAVLAQDPELAKHLAASQAASSPGKQAAVSLRDQVYAKLMARLREMGHDGNPIPDGIPMRDVPRHRLNLAGTMTGRTSASGTPNVTQPVFSTVDYADAEQRMLRKRVTNHKVQADAVQSCSSDATTLALNQLVKYTDMDAQVTAFIHDTYERQYQFRDAAVAFINAGIVPRAEAKHIMFAALYGTYAHDALSRYWQRLLPARVYREYLQREPPEGVEAPDPHPCVPPTYAVYTSTHDFDRLRRAKAVLRRGHALWRKEKYLEGCDVFAELKELGLTLTIVDDDEQCGFQFAVTDVTGWATFEITINTYFTHGQELEYLTDRLGDFLNDG